MHNMFVIFEKDSISLFGKFKEIGIDITAYTYFYADVRNKHKPEILTKYPAMSCDKEFLAMLALAAPNVKIYKAIEANTLDVIFESDEIAQISKIKITT